MLTSETKQKLNSLRDILVGKVPDPKSQVEQITNALIYKYMDDIDQQAIEMGGKASFFIGDYERYSWKNLMDTKVGAQDRMNLYTEALEKMGTNENLSPIFKDILKGAFLPYRAPETLNLFLHEVDGFHYDNSEELGNAFEYLLSIMGSQGDAGMFRTPRHIIDFMTEVVNPTKDDTILDPACGTAGFLISAYKHIVKNHDGIDNVTGKKTEKEKALTPKETKQIHSNFTGYDISPDMTKLSRVNMFLHQFPEPKIYEYDTLSDVKRWDDDFDVILANPPFMTPKGGIVPHNRFGVQANRSEVLFVDYIVEHLKPNGRAGIIVPEGVIFQAGNAYKQLRKSLVEDGLYAVVSLPAGVFNPYSGVKTSILLFDKEIVKKSDEVLFIKIENDGYDLGAQRRRIDKNDLPQAVAILQEWKNNPGVDIEEISQKIKSVKPAIWGENNWGEFEWSSTLLFHPVKKEEIAEDAVYNLTGDLYRKVIDYSNVKWDMVELGEILDYEQPTNYIVESVDYDDKYKTPVLTAGKSFLLGYTNEIDGIFSSEKLPVIIFDDFTTATKFVNFQFKVKSSAMKILKLKNQKDVNIRYVYSVMQDIDFDASTHKRYWISRYSKIKIPLPPLEIQKQIVEELDGYQKVIDGAKQVVENYKPNIKIDPDWKMVKLGDVCDVRDGTHDSPKQVHSGYPLITSKNIKDGQLDFSNISYISQVDFDKVSKRSYVDVDDIIMPMIGTIGGACLIKSKDIEFAIKNVALFKKSEQILPEYLVIILDSKLVEIMFKNQSAGATQKFISLGVLRGLEISLPSVKIQKQIVGEIDIEQESIEKCKKLIEIFEQKIKEKIDEIWGK